MRPQTHALWLSGAFPCVAYVFTTSGFAYWLDSGEFVAAAVQLDIAHPPGHPLSALYGKLLCFLPLGSLSFRVALGQALASAAASVLHCRANHAALSGMRLPDGVAWALALAGAWFSAFTYALWFQAVRPEVYALQTLCVAGVFERLLALCSQGRATHARPLASLAWILGLALTNHHLIALLLVPACAFALLLALRARVWRSIGLAFALGAFALCTYVYLPLRAAHAPPANLGDPSSWSRFAWVVSARVYAREMGSDAVEPLGNRALDVVGLWFTDVGVAVLLLALLGLYAGLRLAQTRAAAGMCALVLGIDAGARAWLGPVRGNPDILGYLAPSFLALGTAASLGLGAACWLWHGRSPGGVRVQLLAAWLAPLAALWLVPHAYAAASLRDFVATDVLDELRLRQLPPRGVVLHSSPQSVFRALELNAVEGARPDLDHVPLPFLRYPGVSEALVARMPLAQDLVAVYLAADDHLQLAPVLRLSEARPTLVELDTRVAPPLYPYLQPIGLLARVTHGQHIDTSALDRSASQLRAGLGEGVHETETARQLLWVHYMNAVQLGALGQLTAARIELERARKLQPAERRLGELERALSGSGPIDPRPFLTF